MAKKKKKPDCFQLKDLHIRPSALKFIKNNRPWPSKAFIVLARDPLLLVHNSDKSWRQDLVKALEKKGYIRTDIDRKALSVWYLYVSTFMVDRDHGWMTYHEYQSLMLDEINSSYESLESEVPEEVWNNVLTIIDSCLPKEQAALIRTRYGFNDGEFYADYRILREKMPEEFRYTEGWLKDIEERAILKLKKIPPKT